MKLHVFNPEHDMALAAGLERFTPSHAGRSMRSSLAFLPALWADEGDMILVDDITAAADALRHYSAQTKSPQLVTLSDLRHLSDPLPELSVWGWDAALRHQLLQAAPQLQSVVPTEQQLADIRLLSHRRWAATHVLPALVGHDGHFVGQSVFVDSMEVLQSRLHDGQWVLKAPWSSSGRGIRYVRTPLTEHQEGWCRNIIQRQGGLMLEPNYNKVADFGMEFSSDGQGHIAYLGLSLFATRGAAYTGNLIASEDRKAELLSQYVDPSSLLSLQQQLVQVLTEQLASRYAGPLGVDMMVLTTPGGQGYRVHPCVELNLRRTMGHVALSLASRDGVLLPSVMSIHATAQHHQLKIAKWMPDYENCTVY